MASKIKVDQIQTGDGTGTIALQNQLSGMTSASMPTGSVLQVVTTQYTTATTWSATTLTAHGASATITPSSTSSKILITVNVHHETYGVGGQDPGLGFAYKRGSTNIWETATAYAYYFYPGASERHEERGWTSLPQYLDSPSTTSATTYALWARKYNSTHGTVFQSSGHPTTITLMEVAG